MLRVSTALEHKIMATVTLPPPDFPLQRLSTTLTHMLFTQMVSTLDSQVAIGFANNRTAIYLNC